MSFLSWKRSTWPSISPSTTRWEASICYRLANSLFREPKSSQALMNLLKKNRRVKTAKTRPRRSLKLPRYPSRSSKEVWLTGKEGRKERRNSHRANQGYSGILAHLFQESSSLVWTRHRPGRGGSQASRRSQVLLLAHRTRMLLFRLHSYLIL